MKIVIRNAGFSAAAAILDRGSMVVLTALLSRSLAPEAFSQFGQFQLTLTMLAAFCGMGVAVSAARLFAEIDADKPTDPTLIGTMWTLSFLIAVMLGIAVVAVRIFTGTEPGKVQFISDVTIFFGIVFLASGIVASGGILGLSLFKRSMLIAGISAVILLGGGWFAARESSANIAAWTLVISYSVTTILSSILVLKRVKVSKIFVSPILTSKRFCAVSNLIGPLAGVSLLSALGNWLIGHILLWSSPSPFAFSGFIIGLQWYSLVQFLPGIMSRAIFPLLVRANVATDSRRALVFSALSSLIIAFCVAAAISICSDLIAKYYDSRSISGGAVVIAFAVAALPQAVVSIIANVLIVNNRQITWLYLSLFSFVAQIVVTFALSSWNALGAAAGMFVAGMVLALATWGYARREGLL